jgi:hypothetical protein
MHYFSKLLPILPIGDKLIKAVGEILDSEVIPCNEVKLRNFPRYFEHFKVGILT